MKVAGLESSVSQAQYRADTAYETARQVQTSSEAWFTELTDADSSLASSLSMMASDLNLRVRPGEIISQINISPETILIDGKRIHITGQTNIDNATITTRLMNGLPTFYAGEESTAWGIETLGGATTRGWTRLTLEFSRISCVIRHSVPSSGSQASSSRRTGTRPRPAAHLHYARWEFPHFPAAEWWGNDCGRFRSSGTAHSSLTVCPPARPVLTNRVRQQISVSCSCGANE